MLLLLALQAAAEASALPQARDISPDDLATRHFRFGSAKTCNLITDWAYLNLINPVDNWFEDGGVLDWYYAPNVDYNLWPTECNAVVHTPEDLKAPLMLTVYNYRCQNLTDTTATYMSGDHIEPRFLSFPLILGDRNATMVATFSYNGQQYDIDPLIADKSANGRTNCV